MKRGQDDDALSRLVIRAADALAFSLKRTEWPGPILGLLGLVGRKGAAIPDYMIDDESGQVFLTIEAEAEADP